MVRHNSVPHIQLPSQTDISIDGDTAVAFTENVEQRFLSYGWQVLHVHDGDR
jgi:transketolase